MFDSIEEAIEDLRAGKTVIVVDDENRENEGDFVALGEKATPEMINFMATEGRGLICAPITKEKAEQLQLNMMADVNTDSHGTAFTVSIDHVETTTGISAGERSKSIMRLAEDDVVPTEFKRPGHIFPLIAKEGGVLRRAGHTEAAIDLARIAGSKPVGAICEIMNEDGSMARVPELRKLADEKGLKLITIEDLIKYRRKHEKLISREIEINLPTSFGDFNVVAYTNDLDGREHLALVKGDINPHEPTLVRVHSECLTGDVFGSHRCDCGPQLEAALKQIEEEGKGVLLYMRQEGRGIGLLNKLKAYKLQEEGYDTVEANHKLGFPADLRDYGLGAQILEDVGVRKMRLLTNNPRKIKGLHGYELELVERVPLKMESNKNNEKYLQTKRDKLGHLF
ncbi:bifunctional 3,4-dihydroxy-2-butanone-4-phosphate synthase/GTP cyclohydrolase II [Allobacillus sp. GCM10007491]|uniref:Riboflavin biosynthesis protein RibBA n=1 Tax=Allobacillus saliphilus TaxID=2912308 RepID=A0A941CVS8_9BACI|nr:bifunctional 3,4-dihydroxy-2-butanone-4-phosphate synthase/GTP cyclohydrolase II [Allobacillus saliphilus]MBR7553595.1 bifunctional 3,4-dihydroxy-2-butanone-4-phosphate synthase/GTP cyclohydrolase II [Allobacillus saliphilus]